MNYKTSVSTYKNRGMGLESDINLSNDYYLTHDVAVIHKKPTPIKAAKVSFSKSPIIKEGFFEKKSTTDYNGLYKGKYIDFEAKETKCSTSFPLSNLKKHQIDHIKKIIKHKGICFILIRFCTKNETYLFKGESLICFLNNNERKSIPKNFIEKNGYLIEEKYNPRLNYLKIVDEVYFEKGDNNEK